jgi:hypothetical protein
VKLGGWSRRTPGVNTRRAVIARVVALAAVLISIPLVAETRDAGDVSEPRAVSGFDRIRVQGAFITRVLVGGVASRLVVSGSQGGVARVTSKVTDRTLIVGMRPGIDSGRSPKLEIAMPGLRGFVNEGAGLVTISGLSGGNVEIENAGAASIVASGRAERLGILLDGAGKIDAGGVDARDVKVENNGVGSVRVRASGLLALNVNGIGEIRYTGNPTHVESHVNGIGRIGRF